MNTLSDTVETRRYLLQLAETPGVTMPDYVGQYTLMDKTAASKLAENLFADPDTTEYPVDTPAATWLSAGIFTLQKTAGTLGYTPALEGWVWGNLLKAAAVHGITADVESLTAAVGAAQEKTAGPTDSQFGWLVKDASGTVVTRRYPMFDAAGVLKAAEFFMQNRGNYTGAVRKEICQNILRKSAEFGVSIDSFDPAVQREAGAGIPRVAVIQQELLHRAQIYKDAELGAAMLKLSNDLANSTHESTAGALDKLAAAIEAADAAEGLQGSYGTKITFPADFLYSVLLKQAEDCANDTIVLSDQVFSKAALASQVSPDVFAAALGQPFADGVTQDGKIHAAKLAAALESLPPAEQHALVSHFRNVYA